VYRNAAVPAALAFIYLPGNATLVEAIFWTVVLSIIAHGVTATPLTKTMSGRFGTLG
jgi:NhaP-type Na+/H+ or K+/H+ antiporter